MAKLLLPRRKTVDLSAPVQRVSRIRRDPPPPVKEVSAVDIKEQDARTITIGIISFALALVVILLAIGNGADWSPSHYTIRLHDSE